MIRYGLQLTLTSDATLGRGDGVAGLVNAEVQHDENGCPYLAGRTLKGMLSEECANILFGLQATGRDRNWYESAQRLFGSPGSSYDTRAHMTVGHAQLPADLRKAIAAGIWHKELSREQVLESLTAIRQQTAVSAETGAPQYETLRALRVVLRNTRLHAELLFTARSSSGDGGTEVDAVQERDLALLAACVRSLRRVGTGRNRGRGAVEAELCDDAGTVITAEYFSKFETEVLQCMD